MKLKNIYWLDECRKASVACIAIYNSKALAIIMIIIIIMQCGLNAQGKIDALQSARRVLNSFDSFQRVYFAWRTDWTMDVSLMWITDAQ